MRAISTLRIRHMLRQACSLALAGIVLLAGCQRNEDRTLADELDRIIEQRQTFNDKKEERISELKRMLDVTGLSPRQEYDINARLCDQYWKYNLDSAIRYAERNLQLARQIRDDEAARTTSLRLTQLYSFSGKSIEAKRILDTTRRNCVSPAQLPLYYETFTRYFEHYAVISNQNKYRLLRDRYNDSLLRVLTPGSYRYKASSGSQLIAQGRTEEAEALLLGLLEEVGENTPQYAEVAYELGGLYTRTATPRRPASTTCCRPLPTCGTPPRRTQPSIPSPSCITPTATWPAPRATHRRPSRMHYSATCSSARHR